MQALPGPKPLRRRSSCSQDSDLPRRWEAFGRGAAPKMAEWSQRQSQLDSDFSSNLALLAYIPCGTSSKYRCNAF